MRLGLALSGGGFRATLYHLGMVRFLRDADLLSQVTHITSVSGGSVLAAHMVVNWDRYRGSPEDFDAASKELLDFIALDVRNRVVRRYPCLALFALGSRLLLRRPSRSLTRTGLLEDYYRRHLFGDVCLHQLPDSPEVHLLSTNVGEGGLASFSRRGLLMQERNANGSHIIKTYRAGLVRVATAVAASSAFPAFFPPMALSAEDVGSTEGEFPRQYFTDGGVYDNLGVRMFHFLSEELVHAYEFQELPENGKIVDAWQRAGQADDSSPLARVVEIANLQRLELSDVLTANSAEHIRVQLNRLINHCQLHKDREFLMLLEAAGVSQLAAEQQLESSAFDMKRSNRDLIVKAFEIAAGEDCLQQPDDICDVILASDAGRGLSVHGPEKTPGFLATAIRSSDILMDRVWHLERQNFSHERKVAFAAVTDLVSKESDPTAMHPELQAQVSRLRTDLDRFRSIEISGLVRQGYCVARQVCRNIRPQLLMRDVDQAPWDPVRSTHDLLAARDGHQKLNSAGVQGDAVTAAARALQRGGRRRVWGGLLDPRDWLTWIYVPLLVGMLGVVPVVLFRAYRHAHLTADLTRAVVETRQDYRKMLDLLEHGTPRDLGPSTPITVEHLGPRLAEQGLDIIIDSRITDLRCWESAGSQGRKRVYVCRYVMVRKVAEASGTASLRLQALWDQADLSVRCGNRDLSPVIRRCGRSSEDGTDMGFAWEVMLDFSGVRVGDTQELIVEIMHSASDSARVVNRDWWQFEVDAQPEVITSWILLPEDAPSPDFNVVRHKNDNPEVVELIDPTHWTKMEEERSILWSVVHPEPGYTYSSRWERD